MIGRIARRIPYIRRPFYQRDQLAATVAAQRLEVQRTRNQYLDLLIRCVSNTIYGDPTIVPGQAPVYAPESWRIGGDWPSVAHTMIGTLRLQNLKEMTELVLREGVPGDLIETGVWRGGACILMRGVLAAYGITDRTVYVADSFSGLPPPNPKQYPADADDKYHTFDQLRVSRAEVEDAFRAYELLDQQVVFVEGWFKDTLTHLSTDRLALIRLDGDMYESTMQALEALYPKLSSGGIAIIDDYGAVPGCRQAVEDFRCVNRIEVPLTTIDWAGVWWRKGSAE